MTLPAVPGADIYAADLYQLCQPSGGQEIGHYYIAGTATAANQLFQDYVSSESRNATPVSISVDQSDQSATNCAAPSTNHLTQGGAQVYTRSSAAGDSNVGGKYTIQY